jgi:hypothetical protein
MAFEVSRDTREVRIGSRRMEERPLQAIAGVEASSGAETVRLMFEAPALTNQGTAEVGVDWQGRARELSQRHAIVARVKVSINTPKCRNRHCHRQGHEAADPVEIYHVLYLGVAPRNCRFHDSARAMRSVRTPPSHFVI